MIHRKNQILTNEFLFAKNVLSDLKYLLYSRRVASLQKLAKFLIEKKKSHGTRNIKSDGDSLGRLNSMCGLKYLLGWLFLFA